MGSELINFQVKKMGLSHKFLRSIIADYADTRAILEDELSHDRNQPKKQRGQDFILDKFSFFSNFSIFLLSFLSPLEDILSFISTRCNVIG